MKYVLLSLLTILFFFRADGQEKKNYLYLELNKNLPVEVSLNGSPLQNDNKGYILVPSLPAGTNRLIFNFSNPNFETHVFEFSTEESLGLKLARVADNKFVLQDVVHKTIIRDITTATARKNVVKTASETAKKVAQNKRPTFEKTKPQVQKQKKPQRRTYAMYKNRIPQTAAGKLPNKNKNYRKLKRMRRKAERQKKAERAVQSPKLKKQQKSAVQNEDQSNETADKVKREKERAQKRKKELAQKKQAKLLAQKRKAARKVARAARKKKQFEQLEADNKAQADVARTKSTNKTRRSKFYEKANPTIGEKIINAEPVGNPAAQKLKSKNNKNTIAPKSRCSTSARSEKVADWTLRLRKKYDDEARTKFIKKKLGKKCISNSNLGVLLGNYQTQIGRYKLIRETYEQLENPEDVLYFQRYFQSDSYIEKLKQLSVGDGQ